MLLNKFKKNKYSVLVLVLTAFVVFELIYLFGDSRNTIQSANGAQLVSYAQMIVEICSQERYHPACYDKEIPKLMDKISMEDAFKVTKIVQSIDNTYPYCHVLGHELSAREVAKDPSKWKDVLTRCPPGACSNGCLHGGLQERLRGAETYTQEQIEEVKQDLADICEKRGEWNPTGLEQASCYHAVGHLAMYLTSADLSKSGEICRFSAVKDDGRNYLQTCYDGNFMQIFQPLEPEDYELIAGKEIKKEKLESFCNGYDGQQRISCWHEGWPLYINEIRKPEGLIKYCNNPILSTEEARNQCFLSLFYVIVVQLDFDLDRLQEYCSALPGNRMDQCFANTASRLIETDYGNIGFVSKYCTRAPTETGKSACYNELIFYSTFNFHAGSKEFYDLCNSLPGEWKDRCLNGANTGG